MSWTSVNQVGLGTVYFSDLNNEKYFLFSSTLFEESKSEMKSSLNQALGYFFKKEVMEN